MANTYIVSGSQFKPYTFDEMIKPALMYKEAYDKMETEASNLDILTSTIEEMLNPENAEDRKLLDKYNSYKKDLSSALESFYTNGYNTDIKRQFQSLKSRYAHELDPINKAYERRIKDMEFIRQHEITNPKLIVEGIGESTAAYMNGKSPAPVVVDLNKATEAAKNASIGLSKQFIEQIGLQNVDGYIGQYLMYGVQKGIDSTMVADFTAYVDAIKKDQTGELKTPQGLSLYNMFEQIRTANNYNNLSKDARDRLDASIIEGLVSGAAADLDIKYLEDNQLNKELIRAQIASTRAKSAESPSNGADLDVRTTTTTYTGENFDVSQIADLMGKQFENPIEYNGTKIYDPIQAYNIIHKDDARIAELAERLDREGFVVKNIRGNIVKYDSWGFNKSVYVGGKLHEGLTQNLREYEQLVKQRNEAYDFLDGIALTDEEVARMREYSKSSTTGMLTQNELFNFKTILASDFTAFSGAEKTNTIFSQTNSKDGLEDMVKTISNNVMQVWQKGHALKITSPDGKEIKDKEFEDLIDSNTGALDSSKISSIELDFTAAKRGAVKLVTTDGKVYYVDADYIGDQAKTHVKILQNRYNNLNTDDDIPNIKKSPEYSPTSGENKLTRLNIYLNDAAQGIQPQYTHNRQTHQSLTD